MEGFLLQPWTTVRGGAGVASMTQDEGDWLDLSDYANVALWIDVSDLSGGPILLNLETAPTADEIFFVNGPVAPPVTLSIPAVSGTPIIVQSVRTPLTAPLARWLRWRLTVSNGAAWSVTFRVRVVPGKSSFFVPTDISGCVLWLRSDAGITLNAANNQVSGWADQSGSNANASQGTAANQPSYSQTGGVRNLPKVTQSGAQFMTGTFPAGMTTYTAFAVCQFPSPPTSNVCFAGTNNTFQSDTGFDFWAAPGAVGVEADTNGGGVLVNTDASSAGKVSIYALTYSTAPQLQGFINGVSIGTQTGFPALSATKYVVLALTNINDWPLNGDAYEFIIFNRVLTTGELTRVHRYLGGRYGIAVHDTKEKVMHTFILQDYITIRGVSSGTINQNETSWLDLSPYQDLIFWTDVKEVSGGTVTLNFQTSPTKDEALFTNLIAGFGFTGATIRAGTDKALMSSATVPVARFVRWSLTGPAAAWDMTFRVYVAANSPGM